MAIYFKNLTIDNFRGIKHLELKNFSSINFILGENNTGKTSIYELMSSIQAPTTVNF